MPSFCRHGRLESNCKICTPEDRVPTRSAGAQAGGRRAPSGPRRGPSRSATRSMTVRKMARAQDDGYANELVLGLRATEDAARLADELAFAGARLRQLRSDPPGVYAEVARAGDAEEAAWLCLQIAYLQPLENEDPWSGINAARVPWATGELPALDDAATGPRSAYVPGRGAEVFSNYRAFVSRAGSQVAALAGEAAWTPARRFDRAFERLAFRGFTRASRYDFLLTLGALGVIDVAPSSLLLGTEPTDPTVVAAKRILGIGDAINLQRRAGDLAAGTEVEIGALDLALVNWSRTDGRLSAGSTAAIDETERDRIATALGAVEPPPALVSADEPADTAAE